MAHLIRRGRIENAHWPLLDATGLRQLSGRGRADGIAAERRADGALVPFQLWLDEADLCVSLGIGIVVGDADDLALLAPHLPRVAVAAVPFARFTNGRGYSIARLLRGRYGYAGELWAIGDIMRDQIYYLSRVGFDAFALRADQDPQEALQALRDFSAPYQASADQPLPLFRRRVA